MLIATRVTAGKIVPALVVRLDISALTENWELVSTDVLHCHETTVTTSKALLHLATRAIDLRQVQPTRCRVVKASEIEMIAFLGWFASFEWQRVAWVEVVVSFGNVNIMMLVSRRGYPAGMTKRV